MYMENYKIFNLYCCRLEKLSVYKMQYHYQNSNNPCKRP